MSGGGYVYAALFYWRNARLVRNARTEMDKAVGEQNLRICASMSHYPVIQKLALRDLTLLGIGNKLETRHARSN